MKKIGKYLLLGTSLLGLTIMASCGDDNKVQDEKINEVIDNETNLDNDNKDITPDQVGLVDPFSEGTEPDLYHEIDNDKINVYGYIGLPSTITGYRNYEYTVIDTNQEINVSVYRWISWYKKDTFSRMPNMTLKEIYSFKTTLGVIMSEEFNKESKKFKFEDIVTIDDLDGIYYENTYIDITYYFSISCDENDFIKYYVKYADGHIESLLNGSQSDGYVKINKSKYKGKNFLVDIVDDKFVDFNFNSLFGL